MYNIQSIIFFILQIKLAGDLGISLNDASYIMVGIGLSSMISCVLFGKICDIESINRLYLNQVSILSVGKCYSANNKFLCP